MYIYWFFALIKFYIIDQKKKDGNSMFIIFVKFLTFLRAVIVIIWPGRQKNLAAPVHLNVEPT